ncbi:hydantoinase B/oxoprolinase family protein [Neobacillus mesonae]|uniref:hydantoinase B/oxoprolinase family protein n=1 Tax=Neobacillus mesonae TaxID=1193713 RepID=UPI002E1B13F7|nr:hydantoinase B/oxoprolinase family protein [Neobacillus mesonae]
MSMMTHNKMNPIMMEVVGHSLLSIAEEMSVTLQRTAYSSIVREAMDFSTALFTANGDLIAQSDNIPTHLGSMGKTLKGILKNYFPKGKIFEGDQIIINHPYLGASHTPDILLFAPVFAEGELVAFCGSMCHHADVGGSVAGSSPTNATEIFQEGLLLPPIKLFERGQENEAVFAIIRANVRMPNYTLGDLRSQISANKVGVTRVEGLFAKYGVKNVKEIMASWIQYSEMMIRQKILEIPDGVYTAEGYLDDDGVTVGQKISLPVSIEVKGDTIIFDFSKVAPQAKGPFNVTKETVWSVAYYITRCITDPDIPQNEGVFRAVDLKLTEGTILHPRFPAPVSGRYHTIMRLSDICFQACSKILPDKIPASSHAHATTIAIGGIHPERTDYFVYYELNGGGMGARPNKDGLSGIDVYVGNCMNVPIEAVELEYPIQFQSYELYQDSGGAGKYRGGLGVVRELKMITDHLTATIRNDGETTNPKGFQGGRDGLPGQKFLNLGTDQEKQIVGKVTAMPLSKGDVITIKTPGSGGYGDPQLREKELIVADWKNGYISTDALRNIYQIDPNSIG